MKIIKFASLLTVSILCSCQSIITTSSSSSSLDKTSSSDTSNSMPEPDKLYEELYDTKSKVEVYLNFTNNAIYKLAKYSSDEVKKEMYHPCDITFELNGRRYEYEESGVRMKGNTSRDDNFVLEDGTIQGLVHFKISFKETFDDVEDNDYYIRTWDDDNARKQRKDREFADQQKLDLKWNKSEDKTFTKQIYAYDAFEKEGVMVSKVQLVNVHLITESDSITYTCQMQETLDEDFLSRRLPKENSKGNLYKSTYTDMGPASLEQNTISSIGVEEPYYHPSYDLKTNDKDDEIDHTLLKNLINTVNANTSSSSEFKKIIDELIDVDSILKYQALCWVMGNPDDSRNNSNNYYIYFDSKTNKASFIPYDFDRCLGILKDWEIHMEDVPLYTTKQNLGGSRPWQPNPLLWRLIISTDDTSVDYSKKWPVIKEYQDQYIQYCVEYGQKYLDAEKFETFTNQFIFAEKNYNEGGANNLTFENYASKKLATLQPYL